MTHPLGTNSFLRLPASHSLFHTPPLQTLSSLSSNPFKAFFTPISLSSNPFKAFFTPIITQDVTFPVVRLCRTTCTQVKNSIQLFIWPKSLSDDHRTFF